MAQEAHSGAIHGHLPTSALLEERAHAHHQATDCCCSHAARCLAPGWLPESIEPFEPQRANPAEPAILLRCAEFTEFTEFTGDTIATVLTFESGPIEPVVIEPRLVAAPAGGGTHRPGQPCSRRTGHPVFDFR